MSFKKEDGIDEKNKINADKDNSVLVKEDKDLFKDESKNMPKRKKPEKKKEGFGAFIKEFVIIVGSALVIAFVLKSFIIDSRIVPTLSMFPTVDAGDRLLINKLAYVGDRTPQRGDVVVFKPPAELNTKDDLCKRVIGLPGDTIEVKNSKVYINGEAFNEYYLAEEPNYTYGPVTVPDGCYFMMGDNRNHSLDSHAWSNPFVPESDIKGKSLLIYWPLDDFGAL